MNEIFKSMNEAIEAADREAAKASRAAISDLATKSCSRCGGKGEDYFMGGARAPGVCFKCGGGGKVFANNKLSKLANERTAPLELIRLRACWKAVRAALKAAKAAASSSWPDRHTVSGLERRLASYEKAGKELAAQLRETA